MWLSAAAQLTPTAPRLPPQTFSLSPAFRNWDREGRSGKGFAKPAVMFEAKLRINKAKSNLFRWSPGNLWASMGVPRRSPDKVMIRLSQPGLLPLEDQSTSIGLSCSLLIRDLPLVSLAPFLCCLRLAVLLSRSVCLSFLTLDGSMTRVR